MTCIVGFVDREKGNVIIGADSAASSDSSVRIRKDKKVFKVGEFVIGCTTSFRMIQLLRYSFKPPKVKTKDIYEYMCTSFIDEIRLCFEKGGFLQKFIDGDEKGGVFLVAHKDRLFKIYDDFQVAENICGYDSCGCGEDYAMGNMFNTTETDSKKIVINALECAENFDGAVRHPFFTCRT